MEKAKEGPQANQERLSECRAVELENECDQEQARPLLEPEDSATKEKKKDKTDKAEYSLAECSRA